jgi:hydrogenase maturation protease
MWTRWVGSDRAGRRRQRVFDRDELAGDRTLPPHPGDVTVDAVQPRLLVAGIGNIFLGDDGFGVEVAKRLTSREWPASVRVADYGIRGMHLAFELLERQYEMTILIDATPRGGEPGTVYLIEPDLGADDSGGEVAANAHGMNPQAVFAMLRSLGGVPGRVVIVGCEPADVEEGIGLSEPVNRAIDEAVSLVVDLVNSEGSLHVSGNSREDRRVP